MKLTDSPVKKRVLWWATWLALTAHLVLVPLLLGIDISKGATSEFGWLFIWTMLPVAIAIWIRWFVLQKITSTIMSFSLFLAGLILTDMSGLMALFLNLPDRPALYCFCIVGMLQFVPMFQ